MCTSITHLNGAPLYGRNLDLEYGFGEQIVITPTHFPLSFRYAPPLAQHYAMIGMAAAEKSYPLYAEATNTHGLYLAGLYFPHSAQYAKDGADFEKNIPLAPYELIPYLLGSCKNIAEAKAVLADCVLVDIPFSPQMPCAPLHWHLADPTGALVIEQSADGLKIYDDTLGVLTNEPPYPFQTAYLTHFAHLSAMPPRHTFAPTLSPAHYGQGFGAIGLPGDASPASRFVRAAFLKAHSVCESEENALVAQFFHILEQVGMVRGSVLTEQGKCDITRYSCCISAKSGIYSYKTYDCPIPRGVRLSQERAKGEKLLFFPLQTDFSFPVS